MRVPITSFIYDVRHLSTGKHVLYAREDSAKSVCIQFIPLERNKTRTETMCARLGDGVINFHSDASASSTGDRLNFVISNYNNDTVTD